MTPKQIIADSIYKSAKELNSNIALAKAIGLTVSVTNTLFSPEVSVRVYEQTVYESSDKSTPAETERKEFADQLKKLFNDGVIKL